MTTISEALQIALQHHQAGRPDLAEEVYRRILDVEPEHAPALHLLGVAIHQRGGTDQAAELVERAIALDSGQPHFHNTLGDIERTRGRHAEALGCFQRALDLAPEHGAIYWNNMGVTWQAMGRPDTALDCIRMALKAQPESAETLNNLGCAQHAMGMIAEALASYRQALVAQPGHPLALSNYLVSLRYDPHVTPAELAAAHHQYDLHAAPLRTVGGRHACTPDPQRLLRLGFVSPSFYGGPVGRFLVRMLENLDRQRFQAVCYRIGGRSDQVTARLQNAVTAWHDVFGANDAEFADRIRGDRIDILFDLAGHAPGNRLPVFARRPAPIQITWIDSVGTTGLSAIDYVLADRCQIPAGHESFYCERVLRMPDCYVCYDPPDYAPPVGPLPSAANSRVTFAAFHNPAKIQPPVVRLWGEILRRVPGSHLLLKYRGMEVGAVADRIRQMFSAAGVGTDRVEFEPPSPHAELLAAYNRTDVTLDPLYNGGLTTCESLWMGVPVVTCPGETFASRHSLSHMTNAGFTETIARDLDEYVEIAVRLASNLPRLAEIRARLRPQMAASPLCDGMRFAENLMDLLRSVWGEWCARAGTS